MRPRADAAGRRARDARDVHVLPAAHLAARRRTRGERALLALVCFNAVDAAAGGIGLVTGAIALPAGTLDGTPFPSPTLPGLILLAAVGGGMAAAAVALWRRTGFATLVAAAAGVVQMGWIAVQLALIGSTSWLQPFILALGAATTALAWSLRRRAPQR